MMTLGLQRSVLLLLCAASALLAGCVSQGKYDALEGKYNALQGQYNQLQSQYAQQQQASAAQMAQSSADIAALKKEIDAGKVHVSRLQNAGCIMLGKLIGLKRKAQKVGGRLKICRLNSHIQEIFRISALDRVFDIYDDEHAALDAFEAGQ